MPLIIKRQEKVGQSSRMRNQAPATTFCSAESRSKQRHKRPPPLAISIAFRFSRLRSVAARARRSSSPACHRA
jgi:hypothetical protein